MQNLYVDVNSPPSSSQQTKESYENKIDKREYEDVDYMEILFPDFKNLKRLGRGAYGTVLQCYFRKRVAAAKLLESNTDYALIHNEVGKLYNFIVFRLNYFMNLNMKILLNYMRHFMDNNQVSFWN